MWNILNCLLSVLGPEQINASSLSEDPLLYPVKIPLKELIFWSLSPFPHKCASQICIYHSVLCSPPANTYFLQWYLLPLWSFVLERCCCSMTTDGTLTKHSAHHSIMTIKRRKPGVQKWRVTCLDLLYGWGPQSESPSQGLQVVTELALHSLLCWDYNSEKQLNSSSFICDVSTAFVTLT